MRTARRRSPAPALRSCIALVRLLINDTAAAVACGGVSEAAEAEETRGAAAVHSVSPAGVAAAVDSLPSAVVAAAGEEAEGQLEELWRRVLAHCPAEQLCKCRPTRREVYVHRVKDVAVQRHHEEGKTPQQLRYATQQQLVKCCPVRSHGRKNQVALQQHLQHSPNRIRRTSL